MPVGKRRGLELVESLEMFEKPVSRRSINALGTDQEFESLLNTFEHPSELYERMNLPETSSALVEIPEDDEFAGGDYLTAEPQVRVFYNACFDYFHDKFFHLEDAEVRLFWKREGGQSGGNNVLGKCIKTSDLVAHYSGANYIIWFAADHLRKAAWSNWQQLGLTFHEMRHTTVNEKMDYKTQGHNWEGFFDELRIFGDYRNGSREIIRVAQQMRLFSK